MISDRVRRLRAMFARLRGMYSVPPKGAHRWTGPADAVSRRQYGEALQAYRKGLNTNRTRKGRVVKDASAVGPKRGRPYSNQWPKSARWGDLPGGGNRNVR